MVSGMTYVALVYRGNRASGNVLDYLIEWML